MRCLEQMRHSFTSLFGEVLPAIDNCWFCMTITSYHGIVVATSLMVLGLLGVA